MLISLRSSTYIIMGSVVNLGSFGVKPVFFFLFQQQIVLNCQRNIVQYYVTDMCISMHYLETFNIMSYGLRSPLGHHGITCTQQKPAGFVSFQRHVAIVILIFFWYFGICRKSNYITIRTNPNKSYRNSNVLRQSLKKHTL